jgi:type I restriction enzyme M protein
MFVQSMKFIESHHGNKKEVSIYGQEYTKTTYKLAKMNLAIRGISANLGAKEADTFSDDQHKDLKADYVMANPPYNQNDWRAENELINDPRWRGYDVPPRSNANFGWILHILSKLSERGLAGFILSNGAISAQGTEGLIRKKLIENDLVEAIIVLPMDMFYTTDTSVTLWILNKDKGVQKVNRDGKIFNTMKRNCEFLFIDARNFGEVYEKKYIMFRETEDITQIKNIYHSWKYQELNGQYKNIPELCYSATLEEIRNNNYLLMPSKYVKLRSNNDIIVIEKELSKIKSDFSNVFLESKYLDNKITNLLKSKYIE